MALASPSYQQQQQQQQQQSQNPPHLQHQSLHPTLNQDVLGNPNDQYQRPNQHMSGFRNPWYSQQQQQQQQASPSSSLLSSSSLSQSPTKSHQIPLLQQQQQPPLNKRLSFANQLPTTYEYENDNNVPPFIHPPTRADNPFNQYFANQEVSLGSNDRRMSVAIDGTHYNPFGTFGQQNNAYPSGPAGVAGHQYLNNPNLGAIPELTEDLH